MEICFTLTSLELMVVAVQYFSSADIWSVGCTIIEMATGKPPWCQYQEVILPSNSQYCNHFVIISFTILRISCICVSVLVFTLVMSVLLCQVQALFHIGTTKSHPPIPEHLSAEAKDFLSKCLQK